MRFSRLVSLLRFSLSRFSTPRFLALSGLVFAAALSRLLPHPPNFAPMTAVALFSGAYLNTRGARGKHVAAIPVIAFAVPMAAMLLSDAGLELLTGWGFYDGMWVTYCAFALVTCLGMALGARRTQLGAVAGTTLAGSLLFFVLTNAAVWALGTMYPHNASGLIACFTAALPFFGNSLLGDAAYSAVLFGGFAIAERVFPALRSLQRVSEPAPSALS
jgi:hypothetical protein